MTGNSICTRRGPVAQRGKVAGRGGKKKEGFKVVAIERIEFQSGKGYEIISNSPGFLVCGWEGGQAASFLVRSSRSRCTIRSNSTNNGFPFFSARVVMRSRRTCGSPQSAMGGRGFRKGIRSWGEGRNTSAGCHWASRHTIRLTKGQSL